MLMGSASAQPYAKAYKRYERALEEGNTEAAIEAAREAFKAAESSDSVHNETLAVLGQNWLFTALWVKPGDAVEISEKVAAPAEKDFGISQYSRAEIRAAADFALANKKPSSKNLKAIVTALETLQSDGPTTTYLVRIHAQSIALLLTKRRAELGYDVATGLNKVVEGVDGVDVGLLADTYLFRVGAMLQLDKQRSVDGEISRQFRQRLGEIHFLVHHALSLFPPQNGLDDFNPSAGRARAWNSLIRSIQSSFDVEPDTEATFEGKQLLESADINEVGVS